MALSPAQSHSCPVTKVITGGIKQVKLTNPGLCDIALLYPLSEIISIAKNSFICFIAKLRTLTVFHCAVSMT